ncbi:3D domain-containing protein [Paenibacillus dakarensis]|uniref:3D domain-containing protein n=1 Tax=Paenibacillus dakarensis TaxID=1527293 RepID=UPI0006D54F0B|nr:3D domain-containing protein [Paenibacillus dakarensis]
MSVINAPETTPTPLTSAETRTDNTGNYPFQSAYQRNKAEESEWRTFEATAYIALCDTGCTGITATGLDVRQHIEVDGRRVCAVDPAVIPLSTALTIRLADGSEIAAIALDTGGAIKGRKVDVLMARESDAWDFGRQAVSIKIDE